MNPSKIGELVMTIEELGEFEQEHLESMTFDPHYDTDIFIMEMTELQELIEVNEDDVSVDDAGAVLVAFFLRDTKDENVTIEIYTLDGIYSDLMEATKNV